MPKPPISRDAWNFIVILIVAIAVGGPIVINFIKDLLFLLFVLIFGIVIISGLFYFLIIRNERYYGP